MPKFKFRFVLVLLLFSIHFASLATANQVNKIEQDETLKRIVLNVYKFHTSEIEKLIIELTSYKDKIAGVSFDAELNQLIIFYTDAIKIDDIFQVVGKHIEQFSKVEGTEIQ